MYQDGLERHRDLVTHPITRFDIGSFPWLVLDRPTAERAWRWMKKCEMHRVELDVERELPGVRVDERAVSEVVYTLIDNAVKYSPQGSTIRIIARRARNESVEMGVEDEGPGIPSDLRERVFDKFFRATRDGDVRNRQPTGTGMGLAIAKGIVEAHQGKIWIESGSNGKGTRVMFTLPIGDEDVVEETEYPAATVETR